MFGQPAVVPQPDAVIAALAPRLWLDARYAPFQRTASIPNRGRDAVTFDSVPNGPKRVTDAAGCRVLEFASANDRVLTSGTVDLTGTQAVWLVAVDRLTDSTALRVLADVGAGIRRAAIMRRNNVATKNTSLVSFGDGGVSTIWTTSEYTNLICGSFVADWSLPAGSEARLRINDTEVATASGAAENTGSFGNQTVMIGADGTGANSYIGNLAQFLLFDYAPTAAQETAVYLALQQMCGVP